MIWGLLALVIAAVFAGAAIYISAAGHPARLKLPAGALLTQWKPSYTRGFAMQASLAVLGGVSGVLAWWTSGVGLSLAGAVVLAANWPFTLLVIMPTNLRLMATVPESADAATRSAGAVGPVACGAQCARRDCDGAVPGGGVANWPLAASCGSRSALKHQDPVHLISSAE